MINAGEVRFRVGIDRPSVDRAIADLERQLANVNDIDLRINVPTANAALSGLERQLEGVQAADIRIDTSQAETQLNRLEETLKRISGAKADESLRGVQNELRETAQAASQARGPLVDVDGVLQTFRGAASFVALDRLVDLFGELTGAVTGFVRSSIEANATIRSTQNALTSVLGSQEAAAENIDELRRIADDTGQVFDGLIRNYSGLSAAAANFGFPQEQVNELFEETSRQLGIFGKSGAEGERVFNALEQIFSKGKVSLEELTGQLGEQLPTALGAAAEGLKITGVLTEGTTEELLDLISTGLDAATFAEGLTEGFRALGGEIDPTQKAIASFENTLGDLQRALGSALEPFEVGFSEIAAQVLGSLDTSSLDLLAEAGERLRQAFIDNPEVIQALADAISGLISGTVDIAVAVLDDFASVIEGLDPNSIGSLAAEIGDFAATALDVVVNIGELSQAFIELGANIGVGAVDAFRDLAPAINVAVDLLTGITGILIPLAENTELVSIAIQVLLVRMAALQAVSVSQSLAAFAASLTGVGVAAGAATTGLTAFAAAAAVAVAPIVALGAAIAAVGFIKFTQDLRVANEELEAFSNGADASGDVALRVANRLNNLNDTIASQGGQATEEQARRLQEYSRIANAQIDDLRNQLRELNSIQPQNDEQRSSLDAIRANLEASIRALETQSKESAAVLESEITGASERAAADSERAAKAAARERAKADQEAAKAFEEAQKDALANIEIAQQNRIAAVRQTQAAGLITEDEANQQVSDIEADAIRERIELREEEIARIEDFASRQAISEKDAADQIRSARQEIANLTLESIEQEIAAQEAAQDAARERAEEARRVAEDQLQTQQRLNDLQAEQVNTQSNIAATALQDQSNLIGAQVSLEQARLSLSRQNLEAKLSEAEAAEDVVAIEEVRDRILLNQRQSIAAEFNARRQQLEIQQQLIQLDATRQLQLGRIAEAEARIAVERARLDDAVSQEELTALQDIVRLREQETEALESQAQTQGNLLTLQLEQLSVEEQLANQRADTERREQAIEAFRRQQKDLADGQLQAERDLASATEQRQRAAQGIVSALSGLQDITQEDALGSLDQLEENLRAARRAGALGGPDAAELQRAIDSAQRFSRGGFDVDEAFRFARQNADNQFAGSILDAVGLGGVSSLLDSQQEIALADSQISDINERIDSVVAAIESLTIPAGVENLNISTPDPVADSAQIMRDMARQQREAAGVS